MFKLAQILPMRAILIFLCIFLITACGEPKASFPDLDLMKHGLPIKIKAPLDAEVKMTDMLLMKDVTVKKDDYYLQIFSSDAMTTDVAKIKADKLNEVKSKSSFSKVIQDDPNGFIFAKMRSDSTTNYDFRHIRLQGDKQYIFQTGLIGKFSEQEVKNMYQSVQ